MAARDDKKRSALALIGLGLVFETVGFATNAALSPGPTVARSLALAITFGVTVVVLGCMQLARAKGRPAVYALLGLLSFIGVAILWFAVPDEKA